MHVRGGDPPADSLVVVRGAPIDASVLWADCERLAKRFTVMAEPAYGFSVEAVVDRWPIARVLREGRVRARASYATCSVGELRTLGCEVLATFGIEPPHFTVMVPDASHAAEVAALLEPRVRPNPEWEEARWRDQ